MKIPMVAVLLCAMALPMLGARQEGVRLGIEGRANATPWADARGMLVAVAWGATAPGGKADVFVAISRDAGATFGAPVRVNAVDGEARLGGELPPRVAIVAKAGGAEPELVVAYGAKNAATEIKVSRSTDGGRSFAAAETLSAPGAAGDRGWHAMTLDHSGRPQVMWLDHRATAAHKAGEQVHREAQAVDGAAMAQRSGLYHAVPGAAPERELTTGVCYCCKVAMTTTADGAIFAAWRHVYPGNIRDIAFTLSRDGGRSFAAPSRVSDDGWELRGCPDDGPAVAQAGGRIHLVWPTVLSGDPPQGAIFYASSADGRTFGPRQRVPTLGAPRPMHPQIAALGPGELAVAWDEVIGGVRQAAIRTLRVDAQGRAVFGAERRLGGPGAASSYPLVVATARGPLAIWVEAGMIRADRATAF